MAKYDRFNRAALLMWLNSIDTYTRQFYNLDDFFPPGTLSEAAIDLFTSYMSLRKREFNIDRTELYIVTAYGICMKYWVDVNDDMNYNTLLAKCLRNIYNKKDISYVEWEILTVIDLDIRRYTESQLCEPPID